MSLVEDFPPALAPAALPVGASEYGEREDAGVGGVDDDRLI